LLLEGGEIKTKTPESYLNKRITVPYTCRNNAYPDPERSNINKTQVIGYKHENTLLKIISSNIILV
jgi:hypothetical protein